MMDLCQFMQEIDIISSIYKLLLKRHEFYDMCLVNP